MQSWRCLQKDFCFIGVVILLCLAIRVPIAWLTYGTEDVNSWATVAEVLSNGQNPYVHTHFLRWPPLWMITIFVTKHLALVFSLEFTTLIKIPPIVADVAIAVLVFYYFRDKRQSWREARLYSVLYALNPVSILITAVHGQFDSFAVMFLFLSLYFFEDYAEDADLMLAAIFLGMAIFSKTWPLLLVPLYIVHVRTRKVGVAFLLIVLLPFVVSVATLYALSPVHIYQKVIRYAGITGWWGVSSLPNVVSHAAVDFVSRLYVEAGSYLLLLAIGAFSLYYYRVYRSGRTALLEALVGAISLIYFFMSGYGTQYMLWILPFILVYAHENSWARYFLILISLELVIEYLFRPYTGLLGEWVVAPHPSRSQAFYSAYASSTDVLVTSILRWPVWLYSGFFVVTILHKWSRFSPKASLSRVKREGFYS